jgi:hypothetical protein
MNLPPPRAKRPRPGQTGGDSLLMLWLDSIPCVRSACEPPENAPLTPEEVDLVAEYLETKSGPAASAEAQRTNTRSRGI